LSIEKYHQFAYEQNSDRKLVSYPRSSPKGVLTLKKRFVARSKRPNLCHNRGEEIYYISIPLPSMNALKEFFFSSILLFQDVAKPEGVET